jgi:hypothetical protein
VTLDGRLDEPLWVSAPAISAFTVVDPNEGSVPTASTRVSVIAQLRGLFIGIECRAAATSIVAFSHERDADFANEDHVRILLDTFLSGRTGYVFAVNPRGARYDALVTNAGEGERKEWDTSWEAVVTRTENGWSAEIHIPIQSLAYKEGLREWGFNVERRVQRLLEVSRWANPRRDARLVQPAHAGRLTGLPAFVYGMGLTLRPAVVSGVRKGDAAAATDVLARLSGDVTQRLGPNALAAVTINTDFAETEVDERRANLTRFPLFFPEKRTFFLEGSDIFDFALSEGRQVDVLPFFSRRIGLTQGEAVPLRVGAKLSGRAGGTSFGALGVRMNDVPGLAPSTALYAVRVKQNVLTESTVGVVATAGNPLSHDGSRLWGADATYRTSRFAGGRNLLLSAWGLATSRDSSLRDRSAWGMVLSYPNEIPTAQLAYKRIGRNFDPALGFVPRKGVEILSAALETRIRQPRPRVREAVLQLHSRVVLDSLRRWESYLVFSAPLYLRFESGDRVELNALAYGERLSLPFAIAPQVSIAPGAYAWLRYRLEGTLATKRVLSGRLTWWFGEFYDGRLDELQAALVLRPSAAAAVELTAVRNVGRLSAGDFTQDVVGARVRYSVSADLSFNTFVQYDNQSRLLGSNSRLRWQFHPLGELYLVHSYNMDRSLGRFDFTSSQFLAKLQYALRF